MNPLIGLFFRLLQWGHLLADELILVKSWRNADISVLNGSEPHIEQLCILGDQTDRFKHSCSIHWITSRKRTSVRQTSSQSFAWNNWNIIDVAEQMFCPHDTRYSQSTHSHSLKAFMRDSNPQHNLSVCLWANYSYSTNHERPFSLCLYCSPVCVLFLACGSNTRRNRCLIDSLWPEKMSCLIRKRQCSTLPPLSFHWLLFSHLPVCLAICLVFAYSSICYMKKISVSLSRL